jgi:hypothetical protein
VRRSDGTGDGAEDGYGHFRRRHHPDELEAVLKDPTEYRRRGAVVVDLAALREMEHIGLVRHRDLQPLWTDVETLSLPASAVSGRRGERSSSGGGCIRFYDTYIQIVTEIILGEEGWQQHLAAMSLSSSPATAGARRVGTGP